jgi:hypothetical protein
MEMAMALVDPKGSRFHNQVFRFHVHFEGAFQIGSVFQVAEVDLFAAAASAACPKKQGSSHK